MRWEGKRTILAIRESAFTRLMSGVMPIRPLLPETSFNSDQTEMIAKAVDDAMTTKKLRDDAIAHIKNNPLWHAL